MKEKGKTNLWYWIRPLLAGGMLFASGLLFGLSTLPEPVPRVAAAAIPGYGNVGAPHLIKVFLSPRCPHCQADLEEHGEVPLDLVREGRLRLEFGVIPLGQVKREDLALYCVEEVRGFEAYYREILALARWYRSGQGAKPDPAADPKVRACLERGDGDRAISRVLLLADLLDVRATPTYFLDGQKREGRIPLRELEGLVKGGPR